MRNTPTDILSFFVIIFTLSMHAQIGMDYEIRVTENSIVYDFETKRILTKEEISSTMTQGTHLVKDYDAYGNPKEYYFVRGIDKGERFDKREYLESLSVNEELPKFISKTYKGVSVKSEDYLGKPLIMAFQLLLTPPLAKTEGLIFLQKQLLKNQNAQMILFVRYDVEGSEPLVQEDIFTSPVISNAIGFSDKYGVFSFPLFLLIDKDGIYRGSFKEIEELLGALSEL